MHFRFRGKGPIVCLLLGTSLALGGISLRAAPGNLAETNPLEGEKEDPKEGAEKEPTLLKRSKTAPSKRRKRGIGHLLEFISTAKVTSQFRSSTSYLTFSTRIPPLIC